MWTSDGASGPYTRLRTQQENHDEDVSQPRERHDRTTTRRADWHSNLIVDRELITGQQPKSAPEFGDMLVAKLNAAKR